MINVRRKYIGTNQELAYPKLMIVDDGDQVGTIVFFDRESFGMVLFGDGGMKNKEGQFSNSWNMSIFKDYSGELIISNKELQHGL